MDTILQYLNLSFPLDNKKNKIQKQKAMDYKRIKK